MKKQFESGMRGDTTKSKIRRRISSLGHGLLVLASVVGAGCAGEDETAVNDRSQDEVDLGVALEGLGTNFTSCTAADSTSQTGFVSASKQLTLTLSANTDAVISVVNGKIKVNGWQCATAAISGPPAVASVDLTTTNVAKIIVAGVATNKVVLDLLPGSFGNIFTGTGGIIIQGGGSVGVRGTGLANNFKVGQEGSGATGPFYFELSGDSRADVRVEGNPTAMSFALGDGNDTFTAQGQVLTTSSLGGSASTGDLVTEAISVFGGLGNDTIKGGLGADTLNGGEGNDWFTTSAGLTPDGADLYIGGTGTDTVDYSGRTVNVSASIAPTYDSGWVEGIDITNASVAAGAMTVNVNGAGATTVTFGSTTVGTTAILGVINGTASLGATAFVNDRGEIVIKATAAGVSLTVAGAAANTLFPGLKTNDGTTHLANDPDDGNSSEGDDIQADVENLIGGSGNDYLSGSVGSNTISGGAGNDDISGGPAGASCAADVDVLNGGDGNDIFRLGALTNCGDAVDGGNGTDVASYELRTVGVSVTIDTTANDGEDLELDKILSTVEVLVGSGLGDTLTGGAGNDEIHGGGGADMIVGGAGNDTIVGGPGADTLLGGTGEDFFNEKDAADSAFVAVVLPSAIGSVEHDVINGGADFDTADYGRTTTTAMNVTLCVATTTTDMGHCLDANDVAIDNDDTADQDDITNVEHFIAGAGTDSIVGSTGNDFIEGGAGADTLEGGLGTDTLFGDGGSDSLNGGAGDDTLDGALGTNTLVGGGGDDICTVGQGGVVDPTCEI